MSDQIDTINDNNLRLTGKQQGIYNGLLGIGEEIASFYIDGIQIINNPALKTKSYLLAHTLREIEGSLRSILVIDDEEPILCLECNRSLPIKGSHIDSICKALDVDKTHLLAKKWHKVARKFHAYAHRHGPLKSPRNVEKVIPLWNEFEDVLHMLVGTYLNLSHRLNTFLSYEKPTKEMIQTLQNMLNNKVLSQYFFKNLKSISWLIPLMESDFFNPSNKPYPEPAKGNEDSYTVPYWSVLGYLEIMAKQNAVNPDSEISNALLKITNSIINHSDQEGDKIDNDSTDWTLLIILSNLPNDLLELNHIKFIKDALNTKFSSDLISADIGKYFLPKLIAGKRIDLILPLMDAILDYRKNEERYSNKYMPIMDRYWLFETLKENKNNVAVLCGRDAAQIAVEKMKRIILDDNHRFSNYSIPTIEDHSQIHSPHQYEIQIVQFVRDIYENCLMTEEVRNEVKLLLKEEHHIFKRLGFHIINKRFDDLKELFINFEGNPLEVAVSHEIYELLKSHCNKFTEDHIDMMIKWIETVPLHEDVLKDKKVVAEIKKEWLDVLLCTDNENVKEKYSHYSAIHPGEVKPPGHHYMIESGTVKEVSPITVNELCQMTNEKLAAYLLEFKDEGKMQFGKLTETSLTSTLKQCVTDNPKKFATDLSHVHAVQPLYKVRILWGLAEAWRNKASFEWSEILDFLWDEISIDKFWTETYKNESDNYRSTIIQAIADLIKEGLRKDEHAFPPELLPKAKQILLHLLDKTKSDLRDNFSGVFGSTKGDIYAAIINYSLRHARLYKQDTEKRWDEDIKNEFTRRLDPAIEPTIEHAVIRGQYLANLTYLDKEWVFEHVDDIFPQDNQVHWEAATYGYFIYTTRAYEIIYKLLSDTGNLTKALNTKFEDKFVTEKLIQHISISYFEGDEDIEEPNGLLNQLLIKADPTQLDELTSYVLTHRGKQKPQDQAYIKALWGKLMEVLVACFSKPEYAHIATSLYKWNSLIEKIDEQVFEWMITLTKYLDKDRYNLFVVEHLLNHVDDTPKYVGELYVELLKNKIFPLYKKENIRELVSKLFNTHPDLADEICNLYFPVEHGDILGDVYKGYHGIK
jgi:hypothetical protein